MPFPDAKCRRQELVCDGIEAINSKMQSVCENKHSINDSTNHNQKAKKSDSFFQSRRTTYLQFSVALEKPFGLLKFFTKTGQVLMEAYELEHD